jgi:hypothetical protein
MGKYKYSGIGKHWGEWVDPGTEDRAAWERLTEEERRPAQDWVDTLGANERAPDPFVPYFAYEFGWSHEEELHRSYLHALQRVTEPDEWVYAIDDPQSVMWYRFWPHRGRVHSRWYASPVPNGDSQFFLAQDFSWGILAFFGGEEWETVDGVFGQVIIDAFDADPPPGWRDSPTH